LDNELTAAEEEELEDLRRQYPAAVRRYAYKYGS
jgi:hypothetical protein